MPPKKGKKGKRRGGDSSSDDEGRAAATVVAASIKNAAANDSDDVDGEDATQQRRGNRKGGSKGGLDKDDLASASTAASKNSKKNKKKGKRGKNNDDSDSDDGDALDPLAHLRTGGAGGRGGRGAAYDDDDEEEDRPKKPLTKKEKKRLEEERLRREKAEQQAVRLVKSTWFFPHVLWVCVVSSTTTAVTCGLLIRDGWFRTPAFVLSPSLRGEARRLSAEMARHIAARAFSRTRKFLRGYPCGTVYYFALCPRRRWWSVVWYRSRCHSPCRTVLGPRNLVKGESCRVLVLVMPSCVPQRLFVMGALLLSTGLHFMLCTRV